MTIPFPRGTGPEERLGPPIEEEIAAQAGTTDSRDDACGCP
jgi:hypothetical protein